VSVEEPREASRWPTVYVETSVISYLAARPSGDPLTRTRQLATQRWWANRSRWNLVVSSAMMIEAMQGDHDYVVRRLEFLEDVPAVQVTAPVRALARELLVRGPLPPSARVDAEHIALAAVNGFDYLVTWNLKHIANPAIQGRVADICVSAGYEPPLIRTPDVLLAEAT
jgi:hypothetical protein